MDITRAVKQPKNLLKIKGTDIFNINPIVSICPETQNLIQFRTHS